MRNIYLLKLLLDEFVIIRGAIIMISKNYEKLILGDFHNYSINLRQIII